MATVPNAVAHGGKAVDLAGSSDGVRLLSWYDLITSQGSKAWQNLVEESRDPNPFFEPPILIPALSSFDRGQNVKLLAYMQEGTLRGVMPLAPSQAYYGYPIPHKSVWLHENAFCGLPLISKGEELGFWNAVLAAMDADPTQALFLYLRDLPEDSFATQTLFDLLAEQDRPFAVVGKHQRAISKAVMTASEYAEKSITLEHRNELQRKRQQLSEHGELSFERRRDSYEIAEWVDAFLELEQANRADDSGSALTSSRKTQAFFRQAMRAAARAGKLERLTFRLDGKPIAMLINLISAPGAYRFRTSIDEQYAEFSPDYLLELEALSLLDHPEIEWIESCPVAGQSMIEELSRENRNMISLNVGIGGTLRRGIFKQLMSRETRPAADQ